jgi:hypothetical protein
MDVTVLEKELKACWAYPYDWQGKKQSNANDNSTRFVYKQNCFADVLREAKSRFDPSEYLFQYSINRWYNYKCSFWIEEMFCSLPGVVPHENKYHQSIDFYVNDIPFDLKVTKILNNFPGGIDAAKEDPKALAQAYYEQQSRGQRHHLENRIFVVLHDHNPSSDHIKLKAELSFIQPFIRNFVENFDPKTSLVEIDFPNGGKAKAGIIFVERY